MHHSLGFPGQSQGPAEGSWGHRNQRAAAGATSPVFRLTFHGGNRGRVCGDQLHVPRVHGLSRRRLDSRGRLDLCGCCGGMVWKNRSAVLRLGILMVVMVEVGGVREMMVVMVVEVWMLLLYSDVPQVPVLSEELVYAPVQLLYPGALGLDETLLVLDDGCKLPQVQNRLHWVF